MTDHLLDALKTADPVDLDQIKRRGAPKTQLQAILAQPRGEAAHYSAPSFSRRGALRLAAPIAVAALLVGAVIAALPGTDEGSSEAVSALTSVASIARADAASPSAPYTYSEYTVADVGSAPEPSQAYSWRSVTTVEQWLAPDGSGRIREETQPAELVGARDQRNWIAAGSPSLGVKPGMSDREVGPDALTGTTGEPGLPAVSDLPADPDQLERVFENAREQSSASVPRSVKEFEYAGAVLTAGGASPELRAAVYDFVGSIDGVSFEGTVRDPIGRVGEGVSIESDYSGIPTRYTLVFDPNTSQPLAQTSRLLEAQPWIDGNLLDYTVLRGSSPATSMQDRP